jgi:formylglycine-generating enzyme required for sulfatase activity
MFSSFRIGFSAGVAPPDVTFAAYGSGVSYPHLPGEKPFMGTVAVGTAGGPSWYGTYDQDGNTVEWVEDAFTQLPAEPLAGYGKQRLLVGGGLGGFPFYRCSNCYSSEERESSYYFNEILSVSKTMNPSHGFVLDGFLPNPGDPYSLSSIRPVRTSAPPPSDARWAEVGEEGNPADVFKKYMEFGFANVAHPSLGSVGYKYWIRKTPVTISEWVSYLNVVDPSGQYADSRRYHTVGQGRNSLTGEFYSNWGWGNFIEYRASRPSGSKYFVARPNSGSKPACGMNWLHAARYCNWVTNGSGPSSGTESGAYTLADETGSTTMSRTNGSVCAIPTLNEWYKSAYYNPSSRSYNRFATRSQRLPQPCGVDQISEVGIPRFTTRYLYVHFPEVT